MKKDKQRDVELVVLGVILGSDRESTLADIPPGMFSDELEPVVDGIRNKQPTALMNWLEARESKPCQGRKPVEQLVQTVLDNKKQAVIDDVCKAVSLGARSTLPLSELRSLLQRSLDKLPQD